MVKNMKMKIKYKDKNQNKPISLIKTRESFDKVRKSRGRFSLRWRLTLLVSVELVVSILFALGGDKLLGIVLPEDITVPLILELIIMSLLVGLIVTRLLSKIFFDPIKELGKAMEKIADGDFTVHLTTKSSSKEIQEIFTGFNLMVGELRSTEVLQTDFVSNVSHEIKTPINAIEGYSTLLQGDDNLSSDQQEYVEKIIFNTRRLSGLVGNILLLSKLENQSIEKDQTLYRLDEQIRRSIVAAEQGWVNKDIDLDVDMESVEYLGSEWLMYHVWDNLIGNAIKFDPPGGLLRIRLFTRDNKIIFTVEDSGPGLSEKTKRHLFDKFYQEDSSHKQEGNGLGLALVKRIVTITGGTIEAENRKEGGCRFTVTLENKKE